MSKKETLAENRVYTVPASGGSITTCYLQACLDDCTGEIFTKETIEKSLADGEAVFSDDFYYATNREALAKFEKTEDAFVEATDSAMADAEASAEPESNVVEGDFGKEAENTEAESDTGIPASETEPEPVKPITVGEVMVHLKKSHIGEVIDYEDGLAVQYVTKNKKFEDVVNIDKNLDKWRVADSTEFFDYQNSKTTDIETVETTEVIEAEPVLEAEPLTKKEEKKLAQLEDEFEKFDALERAVPFEKGRILNEIRQDKLFRVTHKTFGDYAFERFGITREYAQNLAQIAGIPALALEAMEGGGEVNMSVNAANEIMRDSNKVMKSLGIGKVEFDLIVPVMRQTLALMVDIAPKDSQGNVELTPKFISSFNTVIASHLTDGNIEIDGKQMTLKAAHEQGLLNPSLRSEVLESAAEAVKANAQTIREEYKAAAERQQTPILGGGTASELPDNTKYYKGKKPVLNVECTLHGETEILSIGTGKMQTRCGCRWLMDAESEQLAPYECNDLPIKR